MVVTCQDRDGNDRLLMSDSASIRFRLIYGCGSGWRFDLRDIVMDTVVPSPYNRNVNTERLDVGY